MNEKDPFACKLCGSKNLRKINNECGPTILRFQCLDCKGFRTIRCPELEQNEEDFMKFQEMVKKYRKSGGNDGRSSIFRE